MKTTLLRGLLLFAPILGFSQIVVDDTFTVQQLVEDVLINSSCAEVSNFNSDTGSVFNGIGFFEANGSDFPFESGVVLSTGAATEAVGPNDQGGFESEDTDAPADPDLDMAIPTTDERQDRTFIEFTFVPSVSAISFNFLFASEEYDGGFQCTFTDAFAFLLFDASGNVTNLAVLPGVPPPNNIISVTNVHPEVPGSCGPMNEEFFGQYNDGPDPSAIQFNGQTVVLTAMGDVNPGEEYRIKLVIADDRDGIYDSAVFLEAGSFDIGNVDLGDDIVLGDPEAQCEGEIITLDAGENPDASYTWFKDGVEIPGETDSTLDVSTTGLYRVDVTLTSGGDCTASDEILVEFFPVPEFDLGPDVLACDMQMLTLDATVTNPSELNNIMYRWFKDGVEITGETMSTLEVSEAGIYTAEVTGNDCVVTDEIFVQAVDFTVEIGGTINLCGEDSFEIVPEITGQDPSNATYLWSTGETSPTITVTENGTYSVEVTIEGCTATDDVSINFRTLPEIELGPTVNKCAQDVSILTAIPTNINENEVTYRWFMDGGLIANETANTLEVTEEGVYTVEVGDDGCLSSDSVTVQFYDNENCVITQGVSPNGDGQNDFLDLTFLDDKSDIVKLTVFNRYGRAVYEQTDYIKEWGGQTNDGELLPVGTYFYTIELRSEDPITGWIYINK
ncbi:choice-of-anchor L domain-containing protein [Candidatus Ulvibacter alkanivorans]|uniref:choice-of-anchor L domain-containing protein n=1 Tax=Candidatus Ulvibacter alkanivorans TaxID=2267620 RepID=UPI000DF25115|nr:choice-of-anchor L domain-containing protein [Candidatus Ulvibacter alkanivorans]